jgi:lysophospholipase L1-like esterase
MSSAKERGTMASSLPLSISTPLLPFGLALGLCLTLGLGAGCSAKTDGSPAAAPAPTEDSGAFPDAGPDNPAPTDVPATFGGYVILGDSISDRGGEGPFFYDLLVKNNNTKYPPQKGKDLNTVFGPDVRVVKASVSGSVSADLPGQVSSLPTDMEGTIFVTITIGGNDMQANIIDLINNQDQAARAAFAKNLRAALTELTGEGRLGPRTKVKVFQANIYDPSDGRGDYKTRGCPGVFKLLPSDTPSATFFVNWNKVVADTAKEFKQVTVLDMHKRFENRGIAYLKTGGSWFATDCIHPNAQGHDQIRQMFWEVFPGSVE